MRRIGLTGVLVAAVLAALALSLGLPPVPAASPPGGGSEVSPSPGSATLVGAGDIASCWSEGDEATAALLDAIPGTVFTTGDNAYERGTRREFIRCYDPGWGRHRDRTRPVPGNHEYLTKGAAGYFRYFGPAAGGRDTGWYAYDLGAWRVYALNSNCPEVGGCGAGSPQLAWLEADLATHPRACVLAYWHHPLFSSGRHGGLGDVRPLYQALYDAGAEIVLGGHEHSYERFAPQAPDGVLDEARGIVQIVVGTGGRSLFEFRGQEPNSIVRDARTFGVLRLTLEAGRYAFEFVPVPGGTFSDSGSRACH